MKLFSVDTEKRTRAREIAFQLLEQLKGEGISIGEAQCAVEMLGAMVEREAQKKQLLSV